MFRPLPTALLSLWLWASPATPAAPLQSSGAPPPAAPASVPSTSAGIPSGPAPILGAEIHAARQAELSRSPVWRAFRARYGPWSAVWNESARSPHLAFGPAIPLAGFQDDRAKADRAVRAFVGEHAELFGDPTLELVRATRAGSVWYVGYRRMMGGLPVLFEDWEFRIGVGGGLMAFRADAHRLPAESPAEVTLPPLVAEQAARAALGVEGARAEVSGGDRGLLPVPSGEGAACRLVYTFEARSSDPPACQVLLVDAASGAVLWRHDRVRHWVSGSMSAAVHVGLPSGPLASRPLPHVSVTVGPNTLQTEAGGGYIAPSAGTVQVTSHLAGSFCEVHRFDDIPDATFSQSIANPGVVNIAWSDANSQDSERDVYYHVNLAHDWIRGIDPAFTALDNPLPCGVDLGGFCDALWDGRGIYFFSSGISCPNLATMSDAIYHEYGHAMCDEFYAQLGQSFGMIDGALHDGLSDALSCFIRDDPIVGRDFYGPGTSLRTLDNDRQWPRDRSPSDQEAGLIVGGALWDLRRSLGLPLASRLAHFALYGKPDAGNDGDAMAAFFVELLVADDDDGNLANGTPHSAAILAAFNARGIGTGRFLHVLQEEPEDKPHPGPYEVTATVFSSSPLGALAGARLCYSVNGGPYAEIEMSPVGGDDYSTSIPAPQGAIVRYFIRALDTVGGSRTDPPFELGKTELFLAGPATLVLKQEAELPNGWWIGADYDDATGGWWDWGDPNGTVVGFNQQCQPEADHSPSGIMCFFTGQARVGAPPNTNDVDGGATTLFTPVLNATLGGDNPVIEYYRWFSNDLDTPVVDDRWRAWVTNDLGETWIPVEDTMVSDNSWRRVAFFLRDYVTPTDEVALRFTAEDVGQPSLVEAAVDDVHLWQFDVPTTGVAPPRPSFELAATPNPFLQGIRLAYRLPQAGSASMTVLDVQGRRIRSLLEASLAAGPHTVEWDGKDEGGRAVASGLYVVRLEAAGRSLVRRIVRAR